MKTFLVTGGAGFIGSNFIRYLLNKYSDYSVINLDKLTYAGVLQNLGDLEEHKRYSFIQGDICDRTLLENIFLEGSYAIEGVINFAAESHVDRSILDPEIFLRTNVYGTGVLLDVAKSFWQKMTGCPKENFRYIQISTDEVYGTLSTKEPAFTETSPILPNSPYAAGKAGGDHVVRAYHHTYGLPTLITRCSNNYGPYQFPEKLIPLMIHHIIHKKSLPVYGDGKNIRDWIHVLDHCRAIDVILHRGNVGEIYNIGAENEWTNIDIVHCLCDSVDLLLKREKSSRSFITYVADRPGHDQRYGLNIDKIRNGLDWSPSISFEQGLQETVAWYVQYQQRS